jgi:hypothetical protein
MTSVEGREEGRLPGEVMVEEEVEVEEGEARHRVSRDTRWTPSTPIFK